MCVNVWSLGNGCAVAGVCFVAYCGVRCCACVAGRGCWMCWFPGVRPSGSGGERWWSVWCVSPSVRPRWVRLARIVLSPPLCAMCGVWGIGVRPGITGRPAHSVVGSLSCRAVRSPLPPPLSFLPFSCFLFRLSISCLDHVSICLVSVSRLRLLTVTRNSTLPGIQD